MTQIVLHRSGTDPDFRLTRRFDIDVEPLLSKSVDVEVGRRQYFHRKILATFFAFQLSVYAYEDVLVLEISSLFDR